MDTLLKLLRLRAKDYPTEFGQRVYLAAKASLGTDPSYLDLAPDELGCAETVSNVIARAGYAIPIYLSTTDLYKHLRDSSGWAPVGTPLAGDVIISPTGYGGANGITHGHTGIVMDNASIASNNSIGPEFGRFTINYDLAGWRRRYAVTGHYQVYLFRRITN